jgi:hypothetical protein
MLEEARDRSKMSQGIKIGPAHEKEILLLRKTIDD